MDTNVSIFPVRMQFQTIEEMAGSLKNTVATSPEKVLRVVIFIEREHPDGDDTESALSILNLDVESGLGLTNAALLWLVKRFEFGLLAGDF